MTPKKLRDKVLSKYKTGEIVKLKKRNDKGTFVNSQGTEKAEIIKFYDRYALCVVNGNRECFSYFDLINFSDRLKKR